MKVEAGCARIAKQMVRKGQNRPRGITALSIFFAAGALISFTASISLLFPAIFLEPMWRLNPRARIGLDSIGWWSILLLLSVSISCFAAAVGLWRAMRWGHRFAVALIAMNLIGDVANTLLGTEPRAIIGIPIAAVVLWYLLSKRVRLFFRN